MAGLLPGCPFGHRRHLSSTWTDHNTKPPPPIPPHLVYLDLQLELVVLHALQVSVPRLQAAMQVQPHEQRLGAVAPAGHALAVVELGGWKTPFRRVGNLAWPEARKLTVRLLAKYRGQGQESKAPRL